MEPFHWTCPYCDRDTTITSTVSQANFALVMENKNGLRQFTSTLIVCPNPKCRQFSLKLDMNELKRVANAHVVAARIQTWNLIPPSSAKAFPDYVPKPVREDYAEACLIRDLSPKASATLSRRCLQGMIRNFWGISKARLIDEIEAIKDRTDPATWQAIDAIRKIGNIGAHMEKDIDVIVDVDPDEAQILLELIETLVKDWYVVRHDREERLKAIVGISAAKEAAKTASKTP